MANPNPQTVVVADATETYLVRSPFQPGQPVNAQAAVDATVLRYVNNPGSNPLRQNQGIDNSNGDTQKVLRIALDGTTTQFSSADYPALANAHVDGGVLAEADRLRVVAVKRGVGQEFLGILGRVAASGSPTAAQFKTSGAGPILLDLGDAGNAGEDLELWILDAADIVTEATLDQYLLTEVDTGAVVSVDGGAVTLTKIGQGGGS